VRSPKLARLRLVGASILLIGAIVLPGIGQPTVQDKWERIAAEKQLLLDNREVQIHPGELAHLMIDLEAVPEEIQYTPKVKLQKKKAPKAGGCG